MKISKEEVQKDYHWIYKFRYKGYKFEVVFIDNIDPMQKALYSHLHGMLNCHVFMDTPDGKWRNNMRVSKQMFTDVLEDFLFKDVIGDSTIEKYKRYLKGNKETVE